MAERRAAPTTAITAAERTRAASAADRAQRMALARTRLAQASSLGHLALGLIGEAPGPAAADEVPEDYLDAS